MSDTAIEALKYSEFPNSSDCISRQAAIDALMAEPLKWDDSSVWESARCHQWMMDMDVIKALPSARPEPAIPLSWIEGQIKWLKSLDNAFSTLTAGQISAMVNKWKDEQDDIDKPDEKN